MNKTFSYPNATFVAAPKPDAAGNGYGAIPKPYVIKPSADSRTDWYGSPTQHKTLKRISGSFLILLVKPEDWNNPKHNLPVQQYILCEENPRLDVPAGYLCSYKAIEPGSELGVFSSLKQEQEVRFERERWYFDSFF